ncbi:hypothetical protein ACRB68_33880 [Actinomadura sp. RB68]|uniref:Uncharacterized protein n=1 Tax=Actinomadura macrotermitis TaxID=2585200 RepID=A0A7K0BVW3_9ACTN|nr:hypothetical protein [Actinomadura macrotermitis]
MRYRIVGQLPVIDGDYALSSVGHYRVMCDDQDGLSITVQFVKEIQNGGSGV